MATVRGQAAKNAYIAATPAKLANMLRGAARAGAEVIADEIKLRTPSDEVREELRTRTKNDGNRMVVTIDLPPGWARSVGIWLEYGTSPHYISVDPSQSGGRSVERINELHKGGTLVINGKFVGSTVFHPGARPEPAFAPALDTKGGDAIATAQRYLDAQAGHPVPDESEDA